MEHVGVVSTNGSRLWTVYVPDVHGMPVGIGSYAPLSYAKAVAGSEAQRLGLTVKVHY